MIKKGLEDGFGVFVSGKGKVEDGWSKLFQPVQLVKLVA